MQRDHNWFDGWARKHRMLPVCMAPTEHGTLLIADSVEPFHTVDENGVACHIYRTAFCIHRDGAWLASTNEVEASAPEMLMRTQSGAAAYRVNEAIQFGRASLQQTVDVGLYQDRGEDRIN